MSKRKIPHFGWIYKIDLDNIGGGWQYFDIHFSRVLDVGVQDGKVKVWYIDDDTN